MILPAALRYQRELAENATARKAAGVTPDTTLLDAGDRADRQAAGRPGGARVRGQPSRRRQRAGGSQALRNDVLPAMLKVREAADALEAVVDDALAAADLPGDPVHQVTGIARKERLTTPAPRGPARPGS